MILLKRFCSILLSALGLTTIVVEPLSLPVLHGSAGGSSELPSVSLLLCLHAVPLGGPWARARVHLLSVACGVLAVEQAGHAGSLGSSGAGKGLCVKHACARGTCKSPNSCAQKLQLIGCVTSSSEQVP